MFGRNKKQRHGKDRASGKRFVNCEILDPDRIDAQTIIGEYTYVGKNSTITKSTIGRYCSIADNTSIGPGEHHIVKISTSAHFYTGDVYEELTRRDCSIGHDVWIGVDSIVRRGVRIGNGVIVGANSYVNMDVPDFAIVAGNPARVIRYRFDEQKRAKISDSAWWDYDLERAKEILASLEKSL